MKDRDVIIALDMNGANSISFLRKFRKEGLTPFVKIGMELFYDSGINIVGNLGYDYGHDIFLDLKLHDIPTTVEKASKVLSYLPIQILSVHGCNDISSLKAAERGVEGSDVKIAAVTQLTSSIMDITNTNQIMNSIRNIKETTINHVICPVYRACNMLNDWKKICPGIRLEGDPKDDQQWVATPSQAKAAGANYIVVGRSITNAKDPVEAYLRICEEFL